MRVSCSYWIFLSINAGNFSIVPFFCYFLYIECMFSLIILSHSYLLSKVRTTQTNDSKSFTLTNHPNNSNSRTWSHLYINPRQRVAKSPVSQRWDRGHLSSHEHHHKSSPRGGTHTSPTGPPKGLWRTTPAEHEWPREPGDGRLARRVSVRVAQDTLRPDSSRGPLLPRRHMDTRGRYVCGAAPLTLPLGIRSPFLPSHLSPLSPFLLLWCVEATDIPVYVQVTWNYVFLTFLVVSLNFRGWLRWGGGEGEGGRDGLWRV